jgi:hypothetical protein
MGKPTWDARAAFDAGIKYSSVFFKDAYAYFELHRDLEIPKNKVHWLAAALTGRATFVARVPEFLRDWRPNDQRLAINRGCAFGLNVLANLIESVEFLDEKKWRFGITPIPWDCENDQARAYCFEIRLTLQVSRSNAEIFAEKLRSGVKADREFFDAIDCLGREHPDTAGFLLGLFPNRLRAMKARR